MIGRPAPVEPHKSTVPFSFSCYYSLSGSGEAAGRAPPIDHGDVSCRS